MLATERQARILQAVAERRIASTEALASELQVSPETIRRDIRTLDDQGALRRVRGGAASTTITNGEPLIEERQLLNRPAKEAIGRLAADLLEDGQMVILDLGTTAMEVARAMAPGFRGVVATNSLLIAGELAERHDIEVLVCGGRVRGGDLALSNAFSVEFFAQLHADVAFVSSGGVSAEEGLTDFYLDEVATRQQMLRSARQAFVLADSSKFGVVAPYAVAPLGCELGLITDRVPDPELERAIRRRGGAIVSP
ncbi:DeoR/GlpR family DNA-binding transcription regulator [Brooklawnia cerclae]|uniref:DeoR/GlpR family transcriptional regulator of sugar metabolism n=1 Tax=Brooklawnia cerclae TaxID=349934 RepID=A0ABX0SGQ6_9ACTN|nr:DeoR/GlpR family DNA-binding transcription regulator [Brooklawnia cerclae]NIH57573.1 DeoR/GlpR family transcriptional regulator of sugar metabolism [Brooklawnia cerclae]